MLILDGHLSHISLEVISQARANDIHILCLPPHATHLLQPLDVAVFKPVKQAWRTIITDYQRATNFSNLDKEAFPLLLKRLAISGGAFLRRHAVAGFEATGIYPFRRNAISLEKILASRTFHSEDDESSSNNESKSNDERESDDESESSDEIDSIEINSRLTLESDAENSTPTTSSRVSSSDVLVDSVLDVLRATQSAP